MASPQKENGFTPVANEILEALARVKLSPYEWRALMFLFRKTYGHQKKADAIPLSQFSKGMRLDRRLVHRAIKSLESKSLLVIGRDDRGAVSYQFQKDYMKWRVSSRKMTVISRDDKTSSAEMTEVSSPEIPSKEIRKEKRKRVRGKPSPSNGSDPRIKEFFTWWDGEYQKRFSAPYHFNGVKEGTIVKRLLHSYDLPRLCDLAGRFLDSRDPWLQQNSGFTIGIFAGQINKLVSTKNRPVREPKEMPE